jgi:hypothetical protein
MPNPQDSKRPEQSEKDKPGQQPTEPGSKSESRQGQGGRPSEQYPKSDDSQKKKHGSTDEDTDEQGNR